MPPEAKSTVHPFLLFCMNWFELPELAPTGPYQTRTGPNTLEQALPRRPPASDTYQVIDVLCNCTCICTPEVAS